VLQLVRGATPHVGPPPYLCPTPSDTAAHLADGVVVAECVAPLGGAAQVHPGLIPGSPRVDPGLTPGGPRFDPWLTPG